MSTVTESSEQRSQEKCALRFVQACSIDCIPNCKHFFDIDDRTISEQNIERRYQEFKEDPQYHPDNHI